MTSFLYGRYNFNTASAVMENILHAHDRQPRIQLTHPQESYIRELIENENAGDSRFVWCKDAVYKVQFVAQAGAAYLISEKKGR